MSQFEIPSQLGTLFGHLVPIDHVIEDEVEIPSQLGTLFGLKVKEKKYLCFLGWFRVLSDVNRPVLYYTLKAGLLLSAFISENLRPRPIRH